MTWQQVCYHQANGNTYHSSHNESRSHNGQFFKTPMCCFNHENLNSALKIKSIHCHFLSLAIVKDGLFWLVSYYFKIKYIAKIVPKMDLFDYQVTECQTWSDRCGCPWLKFRCVVTLGTEHCFEIERTTIKCESIIKYWVQKKGQGSQKLLTGQWSNSFWMLFPKLQTYN